MMSSEDWVRMRIAKDIAKGNAIDVYGEAERYHMLFPGLTEETLVNVICNAIARNNGTAFWDKPSAT